MKTVPLAVWFVRAYVLTWYFGFILAWRVATRHFYIFRDFPDWVVQDWALDDDDDPGEFAEEAIAQAKEEWFLRKRQRSQRNR